MRRLGPIRPIAAGAAALVVAMTGCGSHKRSAQQIDDCIALAQHSRMVVVFNRLIDKGTFTRDQIVKHFPADLSQGKYLDAAGKFRPFGQLNIDAQIFLIDWAHQLESSKASYADSLFHAETAIPASMRQRCSASS